MDLKMNSEKIDNAGVEWDCKVVGGEVPLIMEDEEDLQCAVMAGFLVKGTVPLIPDAGVPWTDFLQKKISFAELDFYVRESLIAVEKETFYPEYGVENDKLVMTIGKFERSEGE